MSMEQKITNIVRQYVQEWLQQNKSLTNQPLKKILVLLPSEEYRTEIEEVMLELSLICQIYYVDSDELLRTESIWQRVADDAVLIVVPMMPIGHLAKIATLIDDEPIPAIVVHALLARKKVIITTKQAIPSGFAKVLIPANMGDVIEGYLKALQSYGVIVSPFRKLVQVIRDSLNNDNDEASYLVHSKHIREWVSEGEVRIKVPSHTKFTPLAREDMKDFGLQIETTEEESK